MDSMQQARKIGNWTAVSATQLFEALATEFEGAPGTFVRNGAPVQRSAWQIARGVTPSFSGVF